MKPRDLKTLLEKTIPAGLPVLLTGAPGVGKSDITAQAAQSAGADLILSHPAVADPTDAKGLPWPKADGQEATFLPYGELARALRATQLTVWLLDDLGQAPPAVQASYMQLLLARRVNGHALPACVTFIAATNRRIDRAGVSGILEPVKSRFAAIVELAPDLDDWCGWAFDHDIPATLIAFLRFRPELLHVHTPSADLVNSANPRTWANLARLEALDLPREVEAQAFTGAVGEGHAVEYLAFRRMAAALCSIDSILLDPMAGTLPTKPAELYAISVGLSARANSQNLGRIGQFCERLVGDAKGEFAALTLRDACRRTPALVKSDAFTRIVCGPLGQLISGFAG